MQEETSIAQAYHVASIARARLQREAERHDHDLRLLSLHANLLDKVAERIEEVEPDFTLDSLDHIIIEPLASKPSLPKPVRRARIEDILRRIDLSDSTEEDDFYDEVYDESDDDLDEPSTPEKEKFDFDQSFQTLPHGHGSIESLEKPPKHSKRDSIDFAAPFWKGYSVHLPFYRKATPIITVTEL